MKNNLTPTVKELFYNSIADKWEIRINRREMEKRVKIIFNGLLAGVQLKNKRVIEVGCGLGYFCQEMSRRGAVITGIDVGDKLIQIAKRRSPSGKFMVGSALDIPFRKNKYDITLCTEVIEHTENPAKAISELFRVTKPGGMIIITTPNKFYKPFFDLLSFFKIRLYQGNENWLSINNLKKIIARNKGEIVKERYFNFFYPMTILDMFEKYGYLKNLMINQGYLIRKRK